jgi:hypothetical protein
MAIFKSTKIAAKQPTLGLAAAGVVQTVIASVALSDDLALGDMVYGVQLPVGARVTGYDIQVTDLDSSTGLVMDHGIFNAAGDAMATNGTLIAASVAGQAAADDATDAAKLDDMLAYVPDKVNEVYVGSKVTTAATGTKAAGTIYYKVSYVAD